MTKREVEEFTQRLELLYEVAEKAGSVPEVSKLLAEIMSVTQRILRAYGSCLFLVDPEEGEIYVPAPLGETASSVNPVKLNGDSGIAGWVATHGEPLIVNDVTRDTRFNPDIDRATSLASRSLLAVPLVRGQKVIAVLELLNKIDGTDFNDEDLTILTGLMSTEAVMLLVSIEATTLANIKLSQPVPAGCKRTVETLVTVADSRDPYARGHSRRVREYTMLAARVLVTASEELQAIEFGALLHDIGKIGVDDGILSKSGELEGEEWDMVRMHPSKGANIVGEIPYLEKSRDIVLYHHERYDGNGYPDGLKGDKIPIGARLVAVAEAFDTMTTDRSYRTTLPVESALAELTAGAGTQFCPAVVAAFVSEYRKINSLREETKPEATPVAAPREQPQPPPKAAAVVPASDPEVFEGEVRLVIPQAAGFESVIKFRECLRKLDGLKIVLGGWSEDEGNLFVVFLKKPTDLTRLLNEIPLVEVVGKKGKNVVISLKTAVDADV